MIYLYKRFYRNDTVYLYVHAAASKTTQQDAILLTAAHELTHHIRLNAEAQYDALKEFVIEHMLESRDRTLQPCCRTRDLSGIDGDFYVYRNHLYENIKTVKEAKAEDRYNSNKHYHGLGEAKVINALMGL